MFVGNLAMLPASEVAMLEQADWSEERQINPNDTFGSLAQTFSFPKDRIVSGFGLQFTQKDDVIPITIQIRGVTNGLPSDVVIAEVVCHA